MSERKLNKFLGKLYELLDNVQNKDFIAWDFNGERIIIKDQMHLHEKIITSYFRLKKFSSFVRQLHLYNFHKIKSKNQNLIFFNNHFKRDQRHLAFKITRNRKNKVCNHGSKDSDKTISSVNEQQKNINSCSLQEGSSLKKDKIQQKIKSFQSFSSIHLKSYQNLQYLQEHHQDIFINF